MDLSVFDQIRTPLTTSRPSFVLFHASYAWILSSTSRLCCDFGVIGATLLFGRRFE